MSLWIWITNVNPHAFALGVAVISSALAICLIFGIFTRITMWIGIIFSLLI